MIPQLHTSRTEFRRAIDPQSRNIALRTAFISRFIVLREGRRSKAHRVIEMLTWSSTTSAVEICKKIREAFQRNGDKLGPVDRDLRRALEHAERSVDHFINQYCDRSTLTFREALQDYIKSNQLLFGENASGDELPRSGGWRLTDS